MRMCVRVCVWVEHKAEQANPKQQQQLPLMRGLPASTQTSPASPPTSFNTLDGFLRFVVAVAAGIEWLLHGVHFESEKKYKLLLYPHFSVTRRDATQRRRRQRRQGRQLWLWQRRSLSKNISRNTSVCVCMCCVCVRVCASRRLILVAKVIYLLVTRTGTWRGTRWPKLSQMANSWQFDNKEETASSCCCNLAQVTRGERDREKGRRG